MRILVTGSDGLLGESVVALAKEHHDCLALTLADLDVTDRAAVRRTVTERRPDAVIDCAAYTDVDGAESEASLAMEVNARGAEWVAEAAREVRAVVVYVSTDYVFDGAKKTPYREEDVPKPLSCYGVSKLEGERRVVAVLPDDHLIVRTAWLYGPGRGFVDWVCRGLDQSQQLRLVSDHEGSPTYASDLAGAILRLVEQDHRGVFHYVNRGRTSWLGLGRAVAELIGRPDAVLEAVMASELGRPARRPEYSVLAVDKYELATGDSVASWRDALERYLAAAGRLG